MTLTKTNSPKKSVSLRGDKQLPTLLVKVPLDKIVNDRISNPTDIIQSNIMEIAGWLRYAPSDVSWRSTYIKYLGKVFTAPNQYPLLREHATTALLTTGDVAVSAIFEQATQSIVAQIRQLACLGLG